MADNLERRIASVFQWVRMPYRNIPRGLERPGEALDGDFASGLLSISVKRNCHPTLLQLLWAILSSWRVTSGLLPLDHFRGAVCGHSQAAEPKAQPRFFFLLSMVTFWKVLLKAGMECCGSTQTVTVPAPPDVDAEAPPVPVPWAAVKGSSAFSSRRPGCHCIPLTTS